MSLKKVHAHPSTGEARELALLRKRLGALVTENAELTRVDVQTILEATLAR